MKDKLRSLATKLRCSPTPLMHIIPVLNKAADHIENLEKQIISLQEKQLKVDNAN